MINMGKRITSDLDYKLLLDKNKKSAKVIGLIIEGKNYSIKSG